MDKVEKRNIIVFDRSQMNGGRVLDEVLGKEGFATSHFEDVTNALEIAMREKPSVILIDLDEFGEMGWTTCLELKDDLGTRNCGLILLSSKDDEVFKIKGLELGADDFVVKPYSKRELVARIKAVARRLISNANKRIKVKDIEINLDEHRVSKAGKPIDLTYIQFKLLYLLASRRMNVFSRKEILERVWGKKVYVTNRTVDVHIKRLREKLGEYKYPSQYIETIHGTGYRFL
ncbi:response regulator transcription factor [candidate division KSB1 bacterium]|nr:response regulator transcription factor [candidate division KSB1 bacterium]NIR71843.1 response regulator transcription factor [candidate division KSB1 bacterium]NIS25359.1 response regulator transcription factor [candidate division KSB1 bacterium]NIT71829.1 response regulator transcription factor [candidate division KSB1 bacterium]NIU25567.1 response regulator transcription factor [candidate division KSB1 bacterium]